VGGDLILIPYMKALLEEYKAVKDGRIHRGPIGQEVIVRREGPGWLIEIYGTEKVQRDILRDNLMSTGIPRDAAVWVAARCPVTMLPDRELVRAIAALENMGKDDYFGDSYFSDEWKYRIWP